MGKVFLLIAVFLATVAPLGAAVVRLVEEAPGRYRIEGDGLDRVASLDLIVDYDAATLQLPSVTQGSLLQGMLFAGNPNQPGRVRIGAVGPQAISGSGTLANISGTLKSPPAVILGFTAKLSDSSGHPLPVRTQYPSPTPIANRVQPDIPSILEHVAASSPSSTSQSNTVVSIGKVDLSTPWATRETETPPSAEEPEPYVALLPESEPRPQEAPTNTTEPYVEKRQVRIPPILEIFREYEGSRALAKMMQLFNGNAVILLQKPEILLADGETPVEIEFPAKSGKAASLALRNASLLWAGPVGEDRFLVRCIPEKGALSAKILYLGSEEMVTIPLTVVPPVSIAGIGVLKEDPLPRLDLDGDGGNTWRDDYILVANLLAQRKLGKNPETKNGPGISEVP